MALAAPQLQWSIDQTAGSLLSIGRRLIEAATSDNVQILALMTCESFGTTLPVSTITRLKVETLARRNTLHTFRLLKAQIGYRAGDSADALAQSDGGLRFLCLAAILCTFNVGFVRAAEALDKMIRTNSRGDSRLPTVLQLRDLLQALSPKLSSSGFTSEVIGWTLLCAPDREVRSTWLFGGSGSFITPGYTELAYLIEAIQRCYRVGDSDTVAIVNADLRFIPWTVAVVKWLTGTTPPVRKLDGTMLLDSADKTISIEEDSVHGRYTVSLFERVESIHRLISTEGHQGPGTGLYNWLGGFLSVQLWLKARLEALNIELDLANRILPHVVDTLPDAILLCEDFHSTAIALANSGSRRALPQPFPNRDLRRKSLAQILQSGISDSGPGLDAVLGEVNQKCLQECTCNSRRDDLGDDVHNEQAESDDTSSSSSSSRLAPDSRCFKERIGSIIADILALLLFTDIGDDDPYPELSFPDYRTTALNYEDYYSMDSIKIQTYGEYDQYSIARHRYEWHILIVNGWWRVLTGQWLYLSCTSEAIFGHVKQIVGHLKDPESHGSRRELVLSRYGQVIYPILPDVGGPIQEGFLRLVKREGQLWYNDQAFSGIAARSPSNFHPLASYLRSKFWLRDEIPSKELRGSFVPTYRIGRQLTFYVGIGSDTVTLDLNINYPSLSEWRSELWDLFYGLAQTVFSPPCAHSPWTAVGNATTTAFSIIVRKDKDQLIGVLPGDKRLLCDLNGEGALQLVQLGTMNEPCLLLSEGCLGCALAFAANHKINFVVC